MLVPAVGYENLYWLVAYGLTGAEILPCRGVPGFGTDSWLSSQKVTQALGGQDNSNTT